MIPNIKKKGFSLLEIIIALAVIAVIAGLGYSGLINFRATSEMQNVYSEYVSNLRILQNKAKNSINTSANNNAAPDIYAIIMGNNNYSFFNCIKASTFSNNVQCNQDDTLVKKDIPGSLRITPDANCIGIGFAKLTGRIVSLNVSPGGIPAGSLNTNYTATGNCKVTISSTTIVSTKVIKINFDSGSIDL